jgi:VWFA-related protein
MTRPRFSSPAAAWLAVLVLAAIPGGMLAAQDPDPVIRIAAPAEDDYVSGNVRISVRVEPPGAAASIASVTLFADGRQLCVIVSAPFECAWEAGERVVSHQLRAVARLSSGRRIVHTVRTKGLDYAESVDVDVVQVTAVVTDGRGRFVRGLPQGAFRVFEDGRPQPISNFAAGDTPLEMVAAVDVSSSMTGALPKVKSAAHRLLDGLKADDQVTLLGFNDNIFTLARRETNAEARRRALDRLRAWGGTALYDVIVKAVDLLGRQAGRRSIVLFSDGDDQSSLAPIDTAIAKTEGSDATIYAIGQGRAVRAPDLQRLLERLASVSGGRAFFTEDEARLEEVFGQILDDLRNQYVLSYPAPDSSRDGAWHTIRVEVDGGYTVRARQGYRVPAR